MTSKVTVEAHPAGPVDVTLLGPVLESERRVPAGETQVFHIYKDVGLLIREVSEEQLRAEQAQLQGDLNV